MMQRLAAAAFAAFLASCATPPSIAPVPHPAVSVPAAFEMSGRLALRLGDRSEIARLRWQRSTAGDTWILASPVGNEIARIEADGTGAYLQQAGGAREQAASFAALTERLLGVALEPQALARWLHGEAGTAPGGWRVALEEMQQLDGAEVARRLTASRGEATVRLVVDTYRRGG